MFKISSPRYRYTQFFVLFILCFLIYVMAQSIGPGITNFQDNIYKKDFLMEKATLFRYKIGDRIFPGGVIGKDGWMEYTDDGNLDDFQNVKNLENKKKLRKELVALNEFLNSQGITLLIVVAPNKATIYPDKLSGQIKSLPAESVLDKLIAFSKENNLPAILDLRPALRNARHDQDVYYKTNTHWNGYGAFVAYTTIINALGNSHSEIKPYKSADMNLVTTVPGVQDIPGLMHASFITEPYIYLEPKTPFIQTLHPGDSYGYNRYSWIPNSNLPTLLMFHDSFGLTYLNGYLSMNFRESHFIHNYSYSVYLTRESIRQFKPDVIIIEIVERNLGKLVTYLSNFDQE